METHVGERIMLSPDVILADENIRFGLKQIKVDALAENILEVGRVLQNLTVEPLPKAVEGKKYKLTNGFYRHAAVSQLNEKQSAGLELPCYVDEPGSDTQRLMVQVSENVQREDMSPMDKAVAIKKLLDAGVPKPDVRKIFSAPGGRKGLKMQPLSNSMCNILVSFLDFPKPVQEKLHDGRLGVAAGYELRKAKPESWEKILEEAEQDRLKAIDQAEKDDARFEEDEKKHEAARAKAEEDTKALAAAKELESKAKVEAGERLNAAAEAYKAVQTAKGKEAVAKAKEVHGELDKAAKIAQKALMDTSSSVIKLEARVKKAEEAAEERKQKLAEARKAAGVAAKSTGKKVAKGPSPTAVKKAVAKADGNGHVKLTAAQMREAVDSWMLPGSGPKVTAIARALKDCFDGITTDKACFKALNQIVGESKEPAKKAAQ